MSCEAQYSMIISLSFFFLFLHLIVWIIMHPLWAASAWCLVDC